jgi:hypothetical protein
MEVRWNPRSGTQRIIAASAAVTTPTASNDSAQLPDSFLHYEPTYQALICKKHGYAIIGLSTHLRDCHSIPAKVRKAIVEKYNGYALLNPKDVPLPPSFGLPFEFLAGPMEAFLCDDEACEFISKNRDNIRKHCNKTHDWKLTKNDRDH